MRKRALIIASLSILVFAGFTTAASATTIKTTAGATVSANATISGSLKVGTSAVLSSGAGNITCTSSSFSGTIGANPNTPSVTGSLTALTFTNCTDTIPFVTVSSVTTNVGTGANAKVATATYVGAASTFSVSGVTATITFTSGSSCTYAPTSNPATAQHDSTTSPWNNEFRFNAVPLTRTAGTTVCSSTATWSSTYVAVSGGVGITIQP